MTLFTLGRNLLAGSATHGDGSAVGQWHRAPAASTVFLRRRNAIHCPSGDHAGRKSPTWSRKTPRGPDPDNLIF